VIHPYNLRTDCGSASSSRASSSGVLPGLAAPSPRIAILLAAHLHMSPTSSDHHAVLLTGARCSAAPSRRCCSTTGWPWSCDPPSTGVRCRQQGKAFERLTDRCVHQSFVGCAGSPSSLTLSPPWSRFSPCVRWSGREIRRVSSRLSQLQSSSLARGRRSDLISMMIAFRARGCRSRQREPPDSADRSRFNTIISSTVFGLPYRGHRRFGIGEILRHGGGPFLQCKVAGSVRGVVLQYLERAPQCWIYLSAALLPDRLWMGISPAARRLPRSLATASLKRILAAGPTTSSRRKIERRGWRRNRRAAARRSALLPMLSLLACRARLHRGGAAARRPVSGDTVSTEGAMRVVLDSAISLGPDRLDVSRRATWWA